RRAPLQEDLDACNLGQRVEESHLPLDRQALTGGARVKVRRGTAGGSIGDEHLILKSPPDGVLWIRRTLGSLSAQAKPEGMPRLAVPDHGGALNREALSLCAAPHLAQPLAPQLRD